MWVIVHSENGVFTTEVDGEQIPATFDTEAEALAYLRMSGIRDNDPTWTIEFDSTLSDFSD